MVKLINNILCPTLLIISSSSFIGLNLNSVKHIYKDILDFLKNNSSN